MEDLKLFYYAESYRHIMCSLEDMTISHSPPVALVSYTTIRYESQEINFLVTLSFKEISSKNPIILDVFS